MTASTTRMVENRLSREDPRVTPPTGKVMSCTPRQAMMPAARICPESLAHQSSSHRSSTTPSRHTMPAPITTAHAEESMTSAR
jgi:hypothetical protein